MLRSVLTTLTRSGLPADRKILELLEAVENKLGDDAGRQVAWMVRSYRRRVDGDGGHGRTPTRQNRLRQNTPRQVPGGNGGHDDVF